MKSGVRAAWAGILAAFLVVLAGCSGIPRQQRDQEIMDRYLQYAGPPVDHITYLGRYDGWQVVGRYQLVLWASINDAYLITVGPPCDNLQFANRIGITRTANTIYARFDFVLAQHFRCPIQEIRPINYLQLKKDLRAQQAQENNQKAQNNDK